MRKYRGVACMSRDDMLTVVAISALLVSLLIPSLSRARHQRYYTKVYNEARVIAVREFGSIEPPNDELSELERRTGYQKAKVNMDPKQEKPSMREVERNIGPLERYIHEPVTTQLSSQPSA
jgi:hypothetical protein